MILPLLRSRLSNTLLALRSLIKCVLIVYSVFVHFYTKMVPLEHNLCRRHAYWGVPPPHPARIFNSKKGAKPLYAINMVKIPLTNLVFSTNNKII